MTIQELMYKYGSVNDELDVELIKMYSNYAMCDECLLKQKCTVPDDVKSTFESIELCERYLMSVLEV